jgi:hypothetical protein
MELPRAEMAMVDYTRGNAQDLSWGDLDANHYGDSDDWDINQEISYDEELQSGQEPRGIKKKSANSNKNQLESDPSSNDFDQYCHEPAVDRTKAIRGLKTGSSIGASITLAGTPVDHFENGTRISHPRYGLGSVVSVDGFGPKRMARISFDCGQTKSFQLSKSPIDIV